MTIEERERMAVLVKGIQDEKDPQIFDQLVAQLNALMSVKSGRIHSKPESPPRIYGHSLMDKSATVS
jgi:hypothetical protein